MPGLINTPITRNSRLRGTAEAQRERVVRLYQRRNYGPDRVAGRILRAVQLDRAVMPVTAEAWGMWWLARFAPSLARGVARAIDRRSKIGAPLACALHLRFDLELFFTLARDHRVFAQQRQAGLFDFLAGAFRPCGEERVFDPGFEAFGNLLAGFRLEQQPLDHFHSVQRFDFADH